MVPTPSTMRRSDLYSTFGDIMPTDMVIDLLT